MTGMPVSQHRIIRRAFSQYAPVEIFTGTWVDAQLRAMALEAEKNDGEYLLRDMDEPDSRLSNAPYSAGEN